MQINNILIVSPMHKEIQSILEKKEVYKEKNFRILSSEASTDDFKWADAFVAFKRPENFSFENIKWVHSLGAGVDKILKGLEWEKEVPLTRTICSFGQKISEFALSYILRDLQRHGEYALYNDRSEWHPAPPVPLSEVKILIYGTGVIGQEVAKTFSSFGAKVYGVSLSGKKKDNFSEVYASESNYQGIVSDMDYVINTMPITSKTKDLFNNTLFNHMDGVLFINVGRGESVNNTDLLQAIENEKVRYAILDVFQEEPLPANNPFWSHPNVLVTPHISAITTPEEGVACFLDTMARIEAGKELPNLVDLEKGF